MWRGLGRLNDIALGATLQIDDVGILDDPQAFERGVIERFHTNPVRLNPY